MTNLFQTALDSEVRADSNLFTTSALGRRAAWASIPPTDVLIYCGAHALTRVSRDWWVLIGPDDFTDTSWALGALPDGDWDATCETFEDTLVVHYMR